jgi:hypothetical protein
VGASHRKRMPVGLVRMWLPLHVGRRGRHFVPGADSESSTIEMAGVSVPWELQSLPGSQPE